MEKLRLKIIDLCNESGLPIEALMFVLKDVYRDASETFYKIKNEEEEGEKNE